MGNLRVFFLAGVLGIASIIFLLWGLGGQVMFILELRVVKLISLILVGGSVGVATIVFQTISSNKILTPAIMGFDALYLLLQTSLIFILGGMNYINLPPIFTFLSTTTLLVIGALLLFQSLLAKDGRDIHLLLLVGVIFGLLFRSITAFMQRLIDPSEFAMVQSSIFASFGSVDRTALSISVVLFLLSVVLLFRLASRLDVMALGRTNAISLGVSYVQTQKISLVIISVLVSISTVLVGPITFLGLLVSALTYPFVKQVQHKQLLGTSFLIGATILVIGQSVFERFLNLQSTLTVVIEFFGGLLFLFLVVRKRRR